MKNNIVIYSENHILKELLDSYFNISHYSQLGNSLEINDCNICIIDISEDNDLLLNLIENNQNINFIIIGKDLQSDDYIHLNKPIKISNLVEIINGLLKQKSIIVKINHIFNLCKKTKTLIKKIDNLEEKIILTEKEVLLIEFLLNNKSASREEILANIWNHQDSSNTHTLETHIYRLRQKIGEDAELIITTDYGYMLAA